MAEEKKKTLSNKEKQQIDNELTEAISKENLPKIYANGFSIALGLGDVTLLLKNGPIPVGMVNVSFTIAKTLSQKLQDAIGHLEKKTGNLIMTSDDVKTSIFEPDEEEK